ncbi:hypothetical protein [Tumebacillus permanentifrigoris]|uniref:hypothetical protein n=1 Tax=Tumebacillus permanentifrigoris TaxID=378543 RepID=UPI00147388AF|nr:hypothetical protein [Tumebacillus permanentifrigoris]
MADSLLKVLETLVDPLFEFLETLVDPLFEFLEALVNHFKALVHFLFQVLESLVDAVELELGLLVVGDDRLMEVLEHGLQLEELKLVHRSIGIVRVLHEWWAPAFAIKW